MCQVGHFGASGNVFWPFFNGRTQNLVRIYISGQTPVCPLKIETPIVSRKVKNSLTVKYVMTRRRLMSDPQLSSPQVVHVGLFDWNTTKKLSILFDKDVT